MFDAADRQAMLEAVGVEAELVLTGETLWVKRPRYATPQVAVTGLELDTVNPHAIAAEEDIELLSIAGGEDGTLLAISGREYRVLALTPASSGFVSMELGAA